MKHFNVALLGFGTVGSGVYSIINENGAQIAHREGIELSVRGVAQRVVHFERKNRFSDGLGAHFQGKFGRREVC